MKTIKRAVAFSTFCTALFLGSALWAQYPVYYQYQEPRFYVRADAGGTLTSDTDLKEFFGEPLTPGSEVKFNPGIRFGMAGGYRVTPWFAAEAETGIMTSKIDSITDASRVDDAFFSSVPLMANIRFELPNRSRVTPYIGGGAGVNFAWLDVDHISIGSTSMHGSDATAVFAYQGFAGLRFRLNDQMGLSVEYRYFGSQDPEWEAEDSFGTGSDNIKFGRTETHVFSLVFEYRF